MVQNGNCFLFILNVVVVVVANERIKLNQRVCLFVHVGSDYFLFKSVQLIIQAKHQNNDQSLICTADFYCPYFFTLYVSDSKWQLLFLFILKVIIVRMAKERIKLDKIVHVA